MEIDGASRGRRSGLSIRKPVKSKHKRNLNYYVLPYAQTYNFHLYDKTGLEIQKTKQGLAMSESPKPVDDSPYRHKFTMTATRAECGDLFRADDLFVITNKGEYYMTISIRICVAMTNRVPDIYAMSDPFRTIKAKDFNIVESDPLRIKIIK